MAATDVIKTSLERNWGMVDRALEGPDDATLSSQPNDQSNSIALLVVAHEHIHQHPAAIQAAGLGPRGLVREIWHER